MYLYLSSNNNMLKQTFTWPSLLSSSPISLFPHHLLLLHITDHRSSFIHRTTDPNYFSSSTFPISTASIFLKQERESILPSLSSGARRRSAVYDDIEDGEDYGYNEEIAMLEAYTQSSRNEVLLVTAMVDSDVVEVLIFKGFSSCLSYGTSPDPSSSVLPARAMIKSIDRVKGPFNPSNIEYIEKGLTWETFKNRIKP